MNELERVFTLIEVAPVIRMLRDGGVTWEEIAFKFKKHANPLNLSVRQLQRIYAGPKAYNFDVIRRVAKG